MKTYKYTDIDPSKLSIGKINDGTKLRTFFIDYNREIFSVQSPYLMLDWGGIPRIDQYHLTDADRQYVLYGLTPQPISKTRETEEENTARFKLVENFQAWLVSLEEWATSKEVQKKLFGEREVKFFDISKSGSSENNPDKVKFKFYLDRETQDPDFELYEGKEMKSTKDMTLDDLRDQVFRYMGTQRLIFQMRGWTDKIRRRPTPRYGITFIIKSVEYISKEPAKVKSNSVKFIDSSDEDSLDED
jgi:hypothetical protein